MATTTDICQWCNTEATCPMRAKGATSCTLFVPRGPDDERIKEALERLAEARKCLFPYLFEQGPNQALRAVDAAVELLGGMVEPTKDGDGIDYVEDTFSIDGVEYRFVDPGGSTLDEIVLQLRAQGLDAFVTPEGAISWRPSEVKLSVVVTGSPFPPHAVRKDEGPCRCSVERVNGGSVVRAVLDEFTADVCRMHDGVEIPDEPVMAKACGTPRECGKPAAVVDGRQVCPECGAPAESGYGLMGGGVGVYAFCTDDACDWFWKCQDEEG